MIKRSDLNYSKKYSIDNWQELIQNFPKSINVFVYDNEND